MASIGAHDAGHYIPPATLSPEPAWWHYTLRREDVSFHNPFPLRTTSPTPHPSICAIFLYWAPKQLFIYFCNEHSFHSFFCCSSSACLHKVSPLGCFCFDCYFHLYSAPFSRLNRLEETLKKFLYLLLLPRILRSIFRIHMDTEAPAFDWRKAKEMKADRRTAGTAPTSTIHHVAHLFQP